MRNRCADAHHSGRLACSLFFLLPVIACGAEHAPTGVDYAVNPAIFTVGQPGTNAPTITGSKPTLYSIFPALPEGLSFNTSTGLLSGTPPTSSALGTYTVTASNRAGSFKTQLDIVVAPPCQAPPMPSFGETSSPSFGKNAGATCAVVNCAVQCWGSDQEGELGDAASVTLPGPGSKVPISVPNLTNAVQSVVAGGSMACALVSGDVVCWGQWEGCPSLAYGCAPMKIPLDGRAQAIVATDGAGCALTTGGSVQCWGCDVRASNGPSCYQQGAVTSIQGLPGSAQALVAGSDHACALVGGQVFCLGSGTGGPIAANSGGIALQIAGLGGVRSIAASSDQTCAGTDDGVWCWGSWDSDTSQGALNSPLSCASSSSTPGALCPPVKMQGLPGSASALSVGAAHVCALVNGAVWCLGQNDSGQLGDGTTDAGSLTAVQVWGLQQGVLDLAGGADFTCALKTDSTVWCWGSIDLRLFGGSSSTQSNVPVLVSPSGQ